MPIVLQPRVRRRLGRLAALTVAAMFAVPAAAFASSCPAQATTTPFTQWGDTASYFSVADGNFESPLSGSGWIVAGGQRTPGNEPFYVGSSSDSHSLTIEGERTAVSPAFCIDDSMPYFRFFAHALGSIGELQVRLLVQTATGPLSLPIGQALNLTAGSMANWGPTGQLNLADNATGQSALGRLVFRVTGRASWQIDDIYVDPYRTG
jgi:hypothetical protein